ncbi:GGDEF domain-containing protein [Terrarubrum flagellatum]|uniref:GGDEF domain-containing protein n=1 Tax=Terrirubrum flagellatum TaxID=2895980 RepID=UPI0031455B72
MAWINVLLLLVEAAIYFAVMAALFRARKRVGVGLFVCVLGVMHFVETYLASVFYVALPFGVISPGSTVLFSGKLMMLLLLYIKEDAVTVRQPVYGLLAGNFLVVGLAFILRQHEVAPIAGRLPDLAFIDQMGVLMVWGTTLLFIDAIAIILLYEKLGRWLGPAQWPRILIASCCILTFDQIGFYLALRVVIGAPIAVLFGGWFAKMGAAFVFSLMIALYLRVFERAETRVAGPIGDIFDALTYRERYEALVARADRDGLTGLFNRARFDEAGAALFQANNRRRSDISLLLIDVDHFKGINDRFGHSAGDQVLRDIAEVLQESTPDRNRVYRIGGEEFAILVHVPHNVACLLGERVRLGVRRRRLTTHIPATVSVGVASASEDMRCLADLFEIADRHLYAAKADGRDRVRGQSTADAAHAAASNIRFG